MLSLYRLQLRQPHEPSTLALSPPSLHCLFKSASTFQWVMFKFPNKEAAAYIFFFALFDNMDAKLCWKKLAGSSCRRESAPACRWVGFPEYASTGARWLFLPGVCESAEQQKKSFLAFMCQNLLKLIFFPFLTRKRLLYVAPFFFLRRKQCCASLYFSSVRKPT